MTTESSAATQYAEAILELANAAKSEEVVLSDLKSINKLIAELGDLPLILKHPAISGSKKKELLLSIFSGKINDLTLRLLELLADRGRLTLLEHVEKEYLRLLRIQKNIVTGSLTSAEPLSEAQLNGIKEKLAEKLNKMLDLEVKTDKSLIGGFVLRLGDQVIDGSLKGRLQSIEKSLLSV